ncbi:HlyD family secretion protein [Trichothermofontia sp.]
MEATPTESARPPLKPIVPLALGAIALGAGLTIWRVWPRPVATTLQLSGRLEGYPTQVAARVAGRVKAVAVREGDAVTAGAVIVQLDDDELEAQIRGAAARLQAAQTQVVQAQRQIQGVQAQIAEAELGREQSKGDTAGRVAQAEANVAAAMAQLSQTEAQQVQAQAELDLARLDRDRSQQLVSQGAIPQQQFDQAQTRVSTAEATVASRQAVVAAAQRQVAAAQAVLTQAETSRLNPEIRTAQITALTQQLAVAQAQVQAAQAEVANAQAAQQQLLAQRQYLNIVSPLTGVVETRSVEPGEVVTTGTTVMTVIDLDRIYLRGFIPEGEIGKVRVGQSAQVFLDSAPQEPLAATVTAIDTQASFTPENIYFQDDRVKQVFGVKLSLASPQGYAKPGMPADALIQLDQHRIN